MLHSFKIQGYLCGWLIRKRGAYAHEKKREKKTSPLKEKCATWVLLKSRELNDERNNYLFPQIMPLGKGVRARVKRKIQTIKQKIDFGAFVPWWGRSKIFSITHFKIISDWIPDSTRSND